MHHQAYCFICVSLTYINRTGHKTMPDFSIAHGLNKLCGGFCRLAWWNSVSFGCVLATFKQSMQNNYGKCCRIPNQLSSLWQGQLCVSTEHLKENQKYVCVLIHKCMQWSLYRKQFQSLNSIYICSECIMINANFTHKKIAHTEFFITYWHW